jgi:hypothetical protein
VAATPPITRGLDGVNTRRSASSNPFYGGCPAPGADSISRPSWNWMGPIGQISSSRKSDLLSTGRRRKCAHNSEAHQCQSLPPIALSMDSGIVRLRPVLYRDTCHHGRLRVCTVVLCDGRSMRDTVEHPVVTDRAFATIGQMVQLCPAVHLSGFVKASNPRNSMYIGDIQPPRFTSDFAPTIAE